MNVILNIYCNACKESKLPLPEPSAYFLFEKRMKITGDTVGLNFRHFTRYCVTCLIVFNSDVRRYPYMYAS